MRSWLRGHRVAAIATAAVVVVVAITAGLVLARGGGPAKQTAAPPASSPAPTRTAPTRTAPARPVPPPVNPLTGEPGVPRGPVVGVKVDNTRGGRPQWGLNQADVVYVEQVEGGLTRLVAIFDAARAPTRVGPVRSVRGSDPELLDQYGPMALAFSGGAANELASFHGSRLVDASADAQPQAYARVGPRRAPYNLAVDVRALDRAVSRASGLRDVGFRWAATDTRLGQAPRVSRFTALVGSTPVGFGWDAAAGRWLETIGGSVVLGTDGRPVSTPNVIVQFCRVTLDYHDIDQAGSPAAYTHTLGAGRAVLFRDGRRIDGTWTRPHPGDPTRFRTASGVDMLLRPGGVWVLLAATSGPLRVQ